LWSEKLTSSSAMTPPNLLLTLSTRRSSSAMSFLHPLKMDVLDGCTAAQNIHDTFCALEGIIIHIFGVDLDPCRAIDHRHEPLFLDQLDFLIAGHAQVHAISNFLTVEDL